MVIPLRLIKFKTCKVKIKKFNSYLGCRLYRSLGACLSIMANLVTNRAHHLHSFPGQCWASTFFLTDVNSSISLGPTRLSLCERREYVAPCNFIPQVFPFIVMLGLMNAGNSV